MKININLSGLLLIIFVVLKLTGVIAWTWLWVLSPVWVPLAFFASIMLIGIIFTAIAAIF